ncbi:transposable element Tcb2 transposase [Trichonephila clavipes]|nr:transposable element Tcb2 transposase [Trichonephila clavipes]
MLVLFCEGFGEVLLFFREKVTDRRAGRRGISGRKDHHIVIKARVQPTASSAAIQAQVAPSLEAHVSSRTIRRRLAEGHLESRRPLRTPIDASVWSGATHEETGLQGNGTRSSLATNTDSISERYTAPTAGVMEWSAIAYNTRSLLVLIHGIITVQRYVHDILQPHVLSFMQRLPGANFQQDNAQSHTARVSKDGLRTVTTLPWSADPQFVSNRAYLGLFGTESLASHEFERVIGKVTANMERNVSRHHTEVVCLNARSYRIEYSR